MFSRRGLYVLVAVMCVAALCGCRRTKKDGGGSVKLDPTEIGGGSVLGERPAPGSEIMGHNFENVLFAYDSYQVEDGERHKIGEVANYLISNRAVRLVVDGHCDERGSREYNLSLGERRALAVRAHLIAGGIDPERLTTRSFGEDNPLDPDHSDSAWRRNRRAEFHLFAE